MLSCRGRLLKERARLHGLWAVEEGGVDLLMVFVDYAGDPAGGGGGGSSAGAGGGGGGSGGVSSSVIRQKASLCLGRVINAMSDPTAVAAAAAAAAAKQQKTAATTTPPLPQPPSSSSSSSSSSSKTKPQNPPPAPHPNAHLDAVKAILAPYLTPSINNYNNHSHSNHNNYSSEGKKSPSARPVDRQVDAMITSDRIEVVMMLIHPRLARTFNIPNTPSHTLSILLIPC